MAGFSLLEVFIVVTLIGIFFSGVYETVIVGLRTVNAADEREDIRQQLANALELLTREASLANNVDNAEDQRFQFDADLDGNGTTENNINYQVSGNDLQRSYNGVTVTLVRDLNTSTSPLDFDYFNASGTDLTTPVGNQPDRDTIRLAQLDVTVIRDAETITMATAVYLHDNS